MNKITSTCKKISLMLILFAPMSIAYAGCTQCSAPPMGAFPTSSSCPTWCCSNGLAYPVSQKPCTEKGCVGYVCTVGSAGCIKGTVGCGAPCGC